MLEELERYADEMQMELSLRYTSMAQLQLLPVLALPCSSLYNHLVILGSYMGDKHT